MATLASTNDTRGATGRCQGSRLVAILMVSLVALLSLGDLGIGNALLNTVADAQAQNNRNHAVMVVSAAALVVGAIVAFVALILVFLYGRIPWDLAVNVRDTPAAGDAGI